VSNVQTEIDRLSFDLYDVKERDRSVLSDGSSESGSVISELSEGDGDPEEDTEALNGTTSPGLAAELVSWAVGVAFGRFDVRLAIGTRALPAEPQPFDPLPVCSPGMLTGDDDLPCRSRPVDYPLTFPEDGFLVEDPGHPRDLSRAVRSVFDAVFGEESDRWWGDVGMALGAKGGDTASWLRKGFFEQHLKTYSKSRRKAPILWPIGTRSGSYLVWLYAHKVSADSLFVILNDLVVPKLLAEERELSQLRQDAGINASASERRAIDVQERFVGEIRELREQLETLAPLWAPDLNDGVVVVLAPLSPLFAHHRTWATELKKNWMKLSNGDYDWAQLAMHLWPERVVPKCADDRSLAIAHDLEDVFWTRDLANEEKWNCREVPLTPIDELVAQRRNPAVISALERMANR
jgi:hypothetical protein